MSRLPIRKPYIGAGVATLFVVGIAVQSLGTAQAEKYGYNQADCPTIVKQALDTVSSECSKAGRNKLCYGNSTITAQFQPGANNVTFQSPGDTVDVSQIKQFTLGGLDTATNTWGMAEMKIKADLPDTDPTQAVTMILFGDVQVSDGTADANATATHMPAVLRTQTAIAIKRQATLAATTSPNAASQTTGSGGSRFGAMQAFYFQSSDTAPCEQAPHDGILIQSPQGNKQRVTLSIDGAMISLGSTVYLTAQPSKFLTINTLEGSVTVTAAGQTRTVNPGTAVQIPLDANLRASGAPTRANFYSVDTVRALPIQILPNSAVTFAPGFPSNIALTAWTATLTLSGSCQQSQFSSTSSTQINVAVNDSAMWYDNMVFSRLSDGTYTGTESVIWAQTGEPGANSWSLHIDSATHISGTETVSFPIAGTCVWSEVVTPVTSTSTTVPTVAP